MNEVNEFDEFATDLNEVLVEIEKRRPNKLFKNVVKHIDSFDRSHSKVKITSEIEILMNKGKPIAVNEYHFLKTIGQGSFAEVKMATKLEDENDNKVYAVKLIKKHNPTRIFGSRRRTASTPSLLMPPPPPSSPKLLHSISESNTKSNTLTICDIVNNNTLPAEVAKEIYILSQLSHPNLVKLYEIIDSMDSTLLYLVMEYVEAGPVMVFNPSSKTFICKLTNGVMLEALASRIFRDLMSALAYLHTNHVAHRDIKPDNLLIDFHGNLKVSDFGVSNYFSHEKEKEFRSLRVLPHSKSRGVVKKTEGTWPFYSPEMCQGESVSPHSAYMADLWASAVCLWIFIFGTLPFQHENVLNLFELIRTYDPIMPHIVSPELNDLFQSIFKKEPTERLSILDIQAHHWVMGTLPEKPETSEQTALDVPSPHIDKIPHFSPRILEKIHIWVAKAKATCIARLRSFERRSIADLAELKTLSLAEENSPTIKKEHVIGSFSDVIKLKKWAQVAKKSVAVKKVKREKVGKNKKIISWKETAQLSVKTRREKLESKLESTIRSMVERQRLEVQKLKSFQEDDNRDNDSQGSSDFCFSDGDSDEDSNSDNDNNDNNNDDENENDD